MAHFVSRDGLQYLTREEELAKINNRSSEYIPFDYTLEELLPVMYNLYNPDDLRPLIRQVHNIHFITQGDDLYICFNNFDFDSFPTFNKLSEIMLQGDINGAYFLNCRFSTDVIIDVQPCGCWLYNCIFDNLCKFNEPQKSNMGIVEFNFCEFNGQCDFQGLRTLSLEIYNSIFNENTQVDFSNNICMSKNGEHIRIKNTIFKGTVDFHNTIIPHHSLLDYVTFYREVNFTDTEFEKNSSFNNISFAPFVNQSMKDGFNSFVKALANSGYTSESEFYAQNVGGVASNSSINKDEIDIAIKSDWVSIQQAAVILGYSYNTLLTMRKEDNADGNIRIPYKGEGKSTKYYYPLLIAYKSGDMKKVKQLADELGLKQ